MSAEDKKMMMHSDASEGQKSKKDETPTGVESMSGGEAEGRREGAEQRVEKGGVAVEDGSVAGKAGEWPSTHRSSQKLRNPMEEKPRRVKFLRNVAEVLVEMVEGPGTKGKRRIATGDAIGTAVGVLARPNMEKPREPEELTQERIGAILGTFKGAPPVNAPKPTHCRKTCGGGPCLPEFCACVLGEIKCSLDARCQCGPGNCGNFDVVNPERNVVKANDVWMEMKMPEVNDTIQSIDPPIVEEVDLVEPARIDGEGVQMDHVANNADLSMTIEDVVVEEEKEDRRSGEGSTIDVKVHDEDPKVVDDGMAAQSVQFDRFVTRRRGRRNEEEMAGSVGGGASTSHQPNNIQERPSSVQHFLCYTCGIFFDAELEYRQHVLFHELMRIAHHIWRLEPTFRMDVSTSFGEAAKLLHAPYITVRRSMKRCAKETSEEPEQKRRSVDSGSIVDVEKEDCDVVPIDDATLVEIEEEQSALQQLLIDQQLEGNRPDDRFVTRRRKGKEQDVVEAVALEEEDAEGSEGKDDEGSEGGDEVLEDDGHVIMDLEESVSQDLIDEEEEDEEEGSGDSDGSEEVELALREELDQLGRTVVEAGIFEMPIDEARELVQAINMSRVGDGWIVLIEDEDDDGEGNITTRVIDVRYEGVGAIEDEVKTLLDDMVIMISESTLITRAWRQNMEDRGVVINEEALEAPRFVSNLGERISMDRLEGVDEALFDDVPNDSIPDQVADELEVDGESEGSDVNIDGDYVDPQHSVVAPAHGDSGSEDGVDRDGEAEDEEEEEDASTHSIKLEGDGLGDELKRMLPKMLKSSDYQSCTKNKHISESALFCGLMKEASAMNRKDVRIGVLSPSVVKDWQAGKRMKKEEIDQMLFNPNPERILIPIFHPARKFENEEIEHWSVGLYDVGRCTITIFDSIEAAKTERDEIIGMLKDLMIEWVGDDEANCIRYRFARKDRVEKQVGILNKTNSGLFAIVHGRRLVQLEMDCSSRGRSPIDMENERTMLLKVLKTAEVDFGKIVQPTQQQQPNQRKRKLPAVTTPDFIKARRNNTETREKIRRCYSELKKRC